MLENSVFILEQATIRLNSLTELYIEERVVSLSFLKSSGHVLLNLIILMVFHEM
jgi:hypothetical protein